MWRETAMKKAKWNTNTIENKISIERKVVSKSVCYFSQIRNDEMNETQKWPKIMMENRKIRWV